jgi:hypothetical protein
MKLERIVAGLIVDSAVMKRKIMVRLSGGCYLLLLLYC